jgi:fructokinase
MQWGLSRARIVKLSGEEAELLLACPPEEGTERLLRDYGVGLAMVTLGSQGAILQNPNGRVTVAAPIVAPVDTTGAGDIFTGSALDALLELDRSPEELTREDLLRVGRFAVTDASLSTQNPGGMRSMPARGQIQAMLTE